MPYKSNAERERDNWITLLEVVEHICSSEKCDEKVAHQQLVKALADGLRVLGPLKWAREKGDRPPPFGNTPAVAPSDTPPLGRVWLEAKIGWTTGKVRDDWSEHGQQKWRVLLISRLSVLRLWPSPQPSKPDSTPSAEVINLPTRTTGGRPTARDQVHDELQKMRDEGLDLTLSQKRLAEKVAERNGKSLGDRGWGERTIIDHVSKLLREI
jgi:hypothetical protein